MELERMKGILSPEWIEKLAPFIQSGEFDKITSTISMERSKMKIVPRTDRIFTALNKCAPGKIKVVMGLQD